MAELSCEVSLYEASGEDVGLVLWSAVPGKNGDFHDKEKSRRKKTGGQKRIPHRLKL